MAVLYPSPSRPPDRLHGTGEDVCRWPCRGHPPRDRSSGRGPHGPGRGRGRRRRRPRLVQAPGPVRDGRPGGPLPGRRPARPAHRHRRLRRAGRQAGGAAGGGAPAVGKGAGASWPWASPATPCGASSRPSSGPGTRRTARKAAFKRLGYAARGLLYTGLCATAVKLLVGANEGAAQENAATDWTARVLDWPGGRLLVARSASASSAPGSTSAGGVCGRSSPSGSRATRWSRGSGGGSSGWVRSATSPA